MTAQGAFEMSNLKILTVEQLEALEEWMYDQDIAGENYYDERMKIVQELENRRDTKNDSRR